MEITHINVLRLLPCVVSDVPELVILGRRNRAIANFELDQRVRMRPRGENLTRTGQAGLRVAGNTMLPTRKFYDRSLV